MNICFICNDNDLIKKFSSVDEFKKTYTYATVDEAVASTERSDMLIVADNIIGLNEFISRVDDVKNKYSKIYYIVSSENLAFNTKNILEQYGVTMLPPNYTSQKIFELICSKELNFESDNNIVVFFGADNKVGTTMISQSIAEIIAKNSNKKVFLGFMDGFPGTEYIKGKMPGNIDEIKLRLLNRVLDISDIITECKQEDNLYILEGVNNFLYRTEYQLEDMELLLSTLSNNFDIVILDAGCNIELALCLGCLNSTQNRYLVTTPQVKTYNNFQIIYAILDKLNISSFSLILNKYSPEFGRIFEIADRYKFNLACELPFLDNGWQAEMENSTLYSYNDKKYCTQMDILAGIIAQSVAIELNLPKKKTFKLFG